MMKDERNAGERETMAIRFDVRSHTLALAGTLDRDEVRRVTEAAVGLGGQGALTLDLTAVHRCEDSALLMLADALTVSTMGRFAFRGLTFHQARLMRYLGYELDQGIVGTA
jgi:ABC-type transporter Mla MlaB component